MHFPQNPFGFGSQTIKSNYLSELAEIQGNKNRSYTQIKKGVTQNVYQEASLGSVQLVREELSGSIQIHAAPPKQFLPLAVPLSSNNAFRFCGRNREENTLLRATGDEWDVCAVGNFSYAGLILDYDALNIQYQRLHQEELPESWLTSRATKTTPKLLDQYAAGITYLFKVISKTNNLFQLPKTCQYLASSATQMALETLSNNSHKNEKIAQHSRRVQGVYRVIDYLQSYASELPTMAELCVIAELSERSLEYGFKEHLGVTPVRYIKIVRLNGVRKALLSNNSAVFKVSDIALQWGFMEFGRFAADYRLLFGELPSVTLSDNSSLSTIPY